jgi:site-specific DNA recombinase
MQTTYSQSSRRVALYARVPAGVQNKSIDRQLQELKYFCEQNKIDNYELFVDDSQSGAQAKRPALNRMMQAVENDEIETVAVTEFSRYARSVSHMLKGLEVMRNHGVNFVSLNENVDLNTAMGQVALMFISALAQFEKELLANRIRRGQSAAKSRGKKIGRTPNRKSELIESLLKAGSSYRKISRIAKCSQGSVTAQKRKWLSRKMKENLQK